MTRIYEEQSDLEPGQLRTDVSVLYCDPRSVYPKLVVDWWDEARDARLYAGPNPVVAHPPCGPWGRLRHLYRGTEHDRAPIALDQIRRWGGILEHPSWSHLFDRLPRPNEIPDEFGGFTVSVNQCDFGHPARKATWLYCVGVPREALRFPPRREPTHWVSGGHSRIGKKAKTTPVPPGIKICSAQQRRRTPIAFARWLLDLAAQATTDRTGEQR